MISVSAVYLFINISYFAVVSRKDILESRRIVALVKPSKNLCHRFLCVQSFPLQSFIFSESIWTYDRKGGFPPHHTPLLSRQQRHRLLAPSSHYLRWATYSLASFPKAEVTVNQLGPIPSSLIHLVQLFKNLAEKVYFPFLLSSRAIDPSMHH